MSFFDCRYFHAFTYRSANSQSFWWLFSSSSKVKVLGRLLFFAFQSSISLCPNAHKFSSWLIQTKQWKWTEPRLWNSVRTKWWDTSPLHIFIKYSKQVSNFREIRAVTKAVFSFTTLKRSSLDIWLQCRPCFHGKYSRTEGQNCSAAEKVTQRWGGLNQTWNMCGGRHTLCGRNFEMCAGPGEWYENVSRDVRENLLIKFLWIDFLD